MRFPLLAQVLTQANERYQIRAAWQPLLNGLHLWQVWDLDLPLAAWREDIVQWLYVDLPVAGPGQSLVLPEPAMRNSARRTQLWLPSPAQIHIPLLCARPEWKEQ